MQFGTRTEEKKWPPVRAYDTMNDDVRNARHHFYERTLPFDENKPILNKAHK